MTKYRICWKSLVPGKRGHGEYALSFANALPEVEELNIRYANLIVHWLECKEPARENAMKFYDYLGADTTPWGWSPILNYELHGINAHRDGAAQARRTLAHLKDVSPHARLSDVDYGLATGDEAWGFDGTVEQFRRTLEKSTLENEKQKKSSLAAAVLAAQAEYPPEVAAEIEEWAIALAAA